MTAKRKVTKQKTIWVARQTKDGYDDEYIIFVQKSEPKPRQETSYWDPTIVKQYFTDGVTELCKSQWHRATGIRLKRGEIAQIKVSVVK